MRPATGGMSTGVGVGGGWEKSARNDAKVEPRGPCDDRSHVAAYPPPPVAQSTSGTAQHPPATFQK